MPSQQKLLGALVVVSALGLVLGGCGRRVEAGSESDRPTATGEDPTAHVPSGEPIVIVGRVLRADRPPPCGDSQFATAVRYEVLRVEVGSLEEREILVRTVCPEREREVGDAGPVVVGDVHRIRLDPTPYRTQRKIQWIPLSTDRAEP